MLDFKHFGEHPFTFSGAAGDLEAILNVPSAFNDRYIALLGHPHSLQGGTMNNKVVTTLARVFNELGIPSVRFNFRGVGKSQGEYDAGIGESEDMLRLATLCAQQLPGVQFVFAGFSFGSYVSYRAAAQCPHALLISIAPAVHHYDYTAFVPAPNPWIIVHGDADEVVPVDAVRTFVSQSSSPVIYMEKAETSHFFHGKLVDLKSSLIQTIQAQGLLCH